MTCIEELSQQIGGASSNTFLDQSMAPAFSITRLSLDLASASSGLVSSHSSRTALEASKRPSFSNISDSRMTVYSPNACALLMLWRASFDLPSPAARILACSSRAAPFSSSALVARVAASRAAPASPIMNSFADFSTNLAASEGSSSLGSVESLASCALTAISESSVSSSVSLTSSPRAMSLVLFLLSLSGSVPTRRTDCSARTAISSGSIARSLSNVRSKESRSPESL